MVNIGMVIPTWGKQCGVADYTRQLIDHIASKQTQFQIYADLNADLPSAIKKDSIDLVHFQYEYSIYDFTALYHIMTGLTQLRIPIITTLHSWSGDLISHNLLIAARSSGIIVHSNEVKNLCVQQGYPPEKVVVMPIGCNSFPLQAKEKTRKLFDMKGYPCVGFFGFPFPHKGICNLMDALNQIKVYFPEIKGYFFTHYPDYLNEDHPYYSFFRELQSLFDQNDHFIWSKEFLPEPAIVNLLHCMDVNVLPYADHSQKGISAAVRLMLAARRPVITTDYLYFSDLKDEVYKIPDAESGTIAGALCRVLLDGALQERLIANGDLFLRASSWDRIGCSYRELYRKFASTRAGKENTP